MSERLSNHRIRVVFVVFALLFAVTLARSFWLQGVRGPSYEAMAKRQHRETIEIAAARGTIYDRTGEPLAIGEQATTVYADPRSIEDPALAARAAGQALGLDPDELYDAMTDRTRGFVYIARKADPYRAAALQKREIPGLHFYPEELRAYPQRAVAAQVLGYAGLDNEGLEGLERSLDGTLAGRAGFETVVTDPFGRAIDVVNGRPELPGSNVVLTLDNQIQANAEKVLAEHVRRWGARGGTAIVMDPRTGAILAMANAPTYDANRFPGIPADRRRNRAVTDVYEPGSTFKIVTISAALEEGLVTPQTSFWLEPTIAVADRVIRESHSRSAESMTVKRILTESSNVGTVTIAGKLGAGGLSSWVDRFGFGHETGLDFPGESPGMVLPVDEWSGSTIGTVPIGQGVAVTPIQMARAYAAIGNGGVAPSPHLVDRVRGKRWRDRPGRRIVSRATADQVMAMLRNVVVEGTGTEAAIPGYTVAGKTGTAAKPENGVYVRKYVASFVGLVPAEKPRLVVLVAIDEPKGQIWGGVVAAPVFQKISRFALQYLEVPPDAPETSGSGAAVALGSSSSD
ncbi:MAG TPA: penicillin-binding protein 2 [Gaiellaceae bacterium]